MSSKSSHSFYMSLGFLTSSLTCLISIWALHFLSSALAMCLGSLSLRDMCSSLWHALYLPCSLPLRHVIGKSQAQDNMTSGEMEFELSGHLFVRPRSPFRWIPADSFSSNPLDPRRRGESSFLEPDNSFLHTR